MYNFKVGQKILYHGQKYRITSIEYTAGGTVVFNVTPLKPYIDPEDLRVCIGPVGIPDMIPYHDPEVGDIVTGILIENGKTVTGEFFGYELMDGLDPTSVAGAVLVGSGLKSKVFVETDSIKTVEHPLTEFQEAVKSVFLEFNDQNECFENEGGLYEAVLKISKNLLEKAKKELIPEGYGIRKIH